MTIHTLIFDLDDTLLWDEKSIQTAFDQTTAVATNKYPQLSAYELEQAVREEARELYQSFPFFKHTVAIGINPFEGLWGTFDDPGESFQLMKELIPTYQKEAWRKGLLRCGIEDDDLSQTLSTQFIEERLNAPFCYEDTLNVLDTLSKDFQLFLLTNGSPSLQQTKLELTPSLIPYFKEVFISGEIGFGKPDAKIFQHVLDKQQLQPENCLMIGDNLLTDILGASRVGMDSIWINRKGTIPTTKVTPTYEVTSLSEIIAVLQRIN